MRMSAAFALFIFTIDTLSRARDAREPLWRFVELRAVVDIALRMVTARERNSEKEEREFVVLFTNERIGSSIRSCLPVEVARLVGIAEARTPGLLTPLYTPSHRCT